ncbi:hemin uptake protein HemP [Magnetospirillum sp. J10]|uniref:Hemin uptake protein HemP n=2 Tax=Magnetospirillum sulfuroxidans TaxID=611300 RepID=A0ABS5IAL4_9PROT|nr:hemin uptake protein HemP [Magnetospirillum sulfuroxidans]MBR9971471.1 hemin uptake protein HemP [Magnetospirillum sulfuroxidans]
MTGVTSGDARPRVALSTLLAQGTELVIEHDGHDYLLRLTSNGKLLLTK